MTTPFVPPYNNKNGIAPVGTKLSDVTKQKLNYLAREKGVTIRDYLATLITQHIQSIEEETGEPVGLAESPPRHTRHNWDFTLKG